MPPGLGLVDREILIEREQRRRNHSRRDIALVAAHKRLSRKLRCWRGTYHRRTGRFVRLPSHKLDLSRRWSRRFIERTSTRRVSSLRDSSSVTTAPAPPWAQTLR